MSVAIRRTGRYPVAGAWLLRDTPVRTGARARRVAVFARAVAVMIALTGVAVLVSAWRVSRLLAQ
jgi:hypothetical protein